MSRARSSPRCRLARRRPAVLSPLRLHLPCVITGCDRGAVRRVHARDDLQHHHARGVRDATRRQVCYCSVCVDAAELSSGRACAHYAPPLAASLACAACSASSLFSRSRSPPRGGCKTIIDRAVRAARMHDKRRTARRAGPVGRRRARLRVRADRRGRGCR